MKNRKLTILMLCLCIFVLSGCSTKVSNSTSNNLPLNSKEVINVEANKTQLNNIVTSSVPEAESVPQKFYEAINNKNYDIAKSLLGPSLSFMGEDSMRKYWINLEHVEITNFKDISDKVSSLDPQHQKYYSVKFYYANLKIKVKDPKLVPNLNSPQTRKFTVVKINKDSPWLLDGDEDTDQIY